MPSYKKKFQEGGMSRMPVRLPDGWQENGRTGVKRAHRKAGSMNMERRVAWEKVNQSAAPVPEMPRALGKVLIKYFKKEEPSSSSLRDLCSFSTFGVALESPCQGWQRGSRRFSDGESMFLTLQGPELDPRGAWSQFWETGRVLSWQRIRMHFFGAGVQIWVGRAFFSYSGGLPPCVLAHTVSTSQSLLSVIVHIQLISLSWRRAPPFLLLLHPQWKIIEVWEGKCSEFVAGDFQSPALISHPRASIFLFSSGFINVSGALEKNAHLAPVVRPSAHICYLGKRIFFFCPLV